MFAVTKEWTSQGLLGPAYAKHHRILPVRMREEGRGSVCMYSGALNAQETREVRSASSINAAALSDLYTRRERREEEEESRKATVEGSAVQKGQRVMDQTRRHRGRRLATRQEWMERGDR
jgi:hypothetical protein